MQQQKFTVGEIGQIFLATFDRTMSDAEAVKKINEIRERRQLVRPQPVDEPVDELVDGKIAV